MTNTARSAACFYLLLFANCSTVQMAAKIRLVGQILRLFLTTLAYEIHPILFQPTQHSDPLEPSPPCLPRTTERTSRDARGYHDTSRAVSTSSENPRTVRVARIARTLRYRARRRATEASPRASPHLTAPPLEDTPSPRPTDARPPSCPRRGTRASSPRRP